MPGTNNFDRATSCGQPEDRSPASDSRIFISHATVDRSVAETICDHLEQHGLRCWIAPRDISVGQNYDEQIVRGIKACDTLLTLLSEASVASKHVEREVFLASERGLRIIPARIEDAPLSESLEYQIGRTQWIDLGAKPSKQRLSALFERITGDRSEVIGAPQASERLSSAGKPFPFVVAISLLLCALLLSLIWLFPRNAVPDPEAVSQLDPIQPPRAPRAWDEVQDTAAGSILRVAFDQAPPATGAESDSPSLGLQIRANRAGSKGVDVIEDGDRLVSQVDQYSIHVEAHSSGFLYVFQVDSRGSVFWLHPKNSSDFSTGENPVKEGDRIRVPADGQGELFLDTQRGVEQVYAVFSSARWEDLERELKASLDSVDMRSVVSTVDEPFQYAATRGIGGIRPSVDDGTSLPAPSVCDSDGGVLILRRWFYHD